MWISLSASAAKAPPGISIEAAVTAAKALREILSIVNVSIGSERSKQIAGKRQLRAPVRPLPASENSIVFQLVKRARQRENTYAPCAAARTALLKRGKFQHGRTV